MLGEPPLEQVSVCSVTVSQAWAPGSAPGLEWAQPHRWQGGPPHSPGLHFIPELLLAGGLAPSCRGSVAEAGTEPAAPPLGQPVPQASPAPPGGRGTSGLVLQFIELGACSGWLPPSCDCYHMLVTAL